MPETKVLWRKFRSYAGPMIKGTVPYEVPELQHNHVERAFWLTAKVETGARFGSVISYDGTGMTAGLDQHVAVYPRELAGKDDGNALDDQGSLWKLLRRMEYVQGNPGYQSRLAGLWTAFENEGWYVAQDGVLRYALDLRPGDGRAGSPVFGREIRNVLTPMNGNVDGPYNREQAKKWIQRFHLVFSHPDGFRAQVEFGKEHLVKRTKRRGIEWAYGNQEVSALTVSRLGEDLDLAMCMYQAHSVNAPAIANRALKKAADYRPAAPMNVDPRKLIRLLGTSSYGRWSDNLKNGRYQRTRSAARASGLWPKSLFDGKDALMPKDLPG
jgi:hypothetical protein